MEIPAIIYNGISLLVTVLTAVWFLSTRLERLRAQISGQTLMFEEKFKHMELELSRVRGIIDDERGRRANLWAEVNGLRERVAKVEVLK